ncbi:hypothetical protein GQ53DRAFT_827385 [Thozetella sp. PMI_491]|nr:hypothetical protein GQ53DRAFT_827385 [Thozetella sp. PMI_491]
MRFFATIALVAGLSARVLAAPVDTPAPISITIFEDVLYTGSAVTLILPYGACRNIPEGFNDVTSSVKLGPTTSICQMFK